MLMVRTHYRKVFRLSMNTYIMVEYSNPIKEKCVQILTTKPVYRKAEIAYLRYMMRDLDQITLMKDLETLNIRELRMAIGAGVPGHAMHKANELLRDKKIKMEEFIEQDNGTISVEYDEDQPVEMVNDGESGVQTSEERREGDSGTVQE